MKPGCNICYANRPSTMFIRTLGSCPQSPGWLLQCPAMPTYEYVCSKCGHEFEKFQSIADKPLDVCPKDLCAKKKWGRGKVKKVIGAGAGLIFKGSGFYITDY